MWKRMKRIWEGEKGGKVHALKWVPAAERLNGGA